MVINCFEEGWCVETNEYRAEVVFEVSATQPGLDAAVEAAAVRGRIVTVGIVGGRKPEIDLFKFFLRELQLFGVCVYEAVDYEKAIQLIVSGSIDCETLITDIQDLEDITKAFQALDGNATAMKSLIKCS